MGRHRTAEEKAELQERATRMRLAGLGVKRIAGELHVDPKLIRQLLVDVPPPDELMRLNAKDEHREAAMALRREGWTYSEIQDELGVSKSSLSLWLRHMPAPSDEARADLHARVVATPAQRRDDDRDTARALREDGWLLREIAEELGISVKTACVWCQGLPVPERAARRKGRADIADAGRAYWEARRPALEAERLAALACAEARVPVVTDELLRLLAAVAYWCEGAKPGSTVS